MAISRLDRPGRTYKSLCDSSVLDGIRERIKLGPLAPHLETYEQKLKDDGFAIFTGHLWLRLLADFGDWMKEHELALQQVDRSLVHEYLTFRHQRLRPRRDYLTGLRRLIVLIEPERMAIPRLDMPGQTYKSLCYSFVLDGIRERIRQGPLAPFLEAYEQKLKDEGFAIFTGHLWLRLLADVGDWMKDRWLALQQLDQSLVDEYLTYRQQKLRPRHDYATGLRRLLELIQPQSRINQPADSSRVREFAQYLRQERGLAEATIDDYVVTVREFVAVCRAQDRADFNFLQPCDITKFIQRTASRVSAARAKHVVSGLRSFLRFLLQRGALHRDLAACVPTVALWSLSALPRFISAQDVQKVIDSCDCTRPCGLRDRALLLLLARLGLRGAEIMRLTLDDVDWESGVLIIRSKTRSPAQLPLPAEVGEALAQYVQRTRPRDGSRRIFVRHRAPLGDFKNPTVVCCVVKRALRRAGVTSQRKGGHLFRHSLATHMLSNGASLAEIGEILRHSRLQTTFIYAKLDIISLRAIAPHWPVGV